MVLEYSKALPGARVKRYPERKAYIGRTIEIGSSNQTSPFTTACARGIPVQTLVTEAIANTV